MSFNRTNATATVFFLYLMPVLFLTIYSLGEMPPHSSWMIFAVGLFGGLLGSICFFWMLYTYANAEPQVPPQPTQEIPKVIERESEELLQLRAERLLWEEKIHATELDLEQHEKRLQMELQERDSLIEQLQEQVDHLEERERELKYEIKTLLQVSRT